MKLLAFLWIAFALNYVDRQMVYSMLPALRGELGFSPTELAWIGTIFLWPYTVALPVAGLLADRLRRDRLILLSLALWSSATLGCSLATSTTSFLAWRAVMGVTEALYYPTALALISAHYPEAQRSRMLGIHQSAQFAGGVLGGWYGGWAADNTGWRSAFLIAGLAGLLFGPILWRGQPAMGLPPLQSFSSAGGDLLYVLLDPVDLLRLVPDPFAGSISHVDDRQRLCINVLCAVGHHRRHPRGRLPGRSVAPAMAAVSFADHGGRGVLLCSLWLSRFLE
jgi:MFS family permease